MDPQNKFSSFVFNIKKPIIYGNRIKIVLDFIRIGESHSQNKMFQAGELLNIKQASIWATAHTGKNVTPSNITYLTISPQRFRRFPRGKRQI